MTTPAPALFKPSFALTVQGAQTAMDAAAAEADANGWAVTIAVSDAAGVPLLLQRRGAQAFSVDVAIGKARTAASTGRETASFETTVNGSDDARARLAPPQSWSAPPS